jgi:hypothetical protein
MDPFRIFQSPIEPLIRAFTQCSKAVTPSQHAKQDHQSKFFVVFHLFVQWDSTKEMQHLMRKSSKSWSFVLQKDLKF